MRKIFSIITFVVASLAIVWLFVTSTTYIQLAVAVLLYPPIAYFAFALFPHNNRISEVNSGEINQKPSVVIQPVGQKVSANGQVRESVDIVDIDKRTFLKLVGTAGISFFIFSILSRRVESLLFGKAFDSGVTGIPGQYAQNPGPSPDQPTEGYKITEIDDLNETTYFGFTNISGGWLIMKGDAEVSSYRYIKGDTDFPKFWANREHLKYDYYYNLF